MRSSVYFQEDRENNFCVSCLCGVCVCVYVCVLTMFVCMLVIDNWRLLSIKITTEGYVKNIDNWRLLNIKNFIELLCIHPELEDFWSEITTC